MATETEIAWAAGFIDGEGCLHLSKTGRTTKLTRYPILKATQVNREPLDKLQSIFGGSVRARTQPTSTGKIAYDWTVGGGTSLREILPLLMPHLTTKRKQAQILLEYVDGMRVNGSGSYALSKEERAIRLDLIERFAEARSWIG